MPKRTKREFTRKNTKKVTSKKACRFCIDSENIIDYKRSKMLAHFISERCKIAPRRVTGNCQFHQTRIVEAIKRARHLALLPYTVQHVIRN
ncbi:MAG: 30S ribosomal protein S18 [Deltaproteobacteria bacterium]|nr:30S ribosomal protein S18 [Deltaproteobacteria bacterium]